MKLSPYLVVCVVAPLVFLAGESTSAFLGPQGVATSTSLGQVAFQADATPISFGSVSGNVYTNDSLGITFDFPSGWFVDKRSMQAENESANRFFSQAQQVSNGHKSYTLLIVSQLQEQATCHGCESVRVTDPRIVLCAGALGMSEQNKSAADIQTGIKRKLEQRKGYEITRGPESCSFGGQAFSRMDTKARTFAGNFGFLGDVIAIRQGHSIEFQLHARTPEELEMLYQTLNSLRFDPLAETRQ